MYAWADFTSGHKKEQRRSILGYIISIRIGGDPFQIGSILFACISKIYTRENAIPRNVIFISVLCVAGTWIVYEVYTTKILWC